MGARRALEQFQRSVREHGLADVATAMPVDCMGVCQNGPVVRALPMQRWLLGVNAATAKQLADRLAQQRAQRPQDKGD